MTAARVKTAGVSLIEMLVVLALFGVVAGAVVMSAPSGTRATSTDAAARALAAHLGHAVDHTLTTGKGFGIIRDGTDIRFVQRGPGATWVAHSDKRLRQVKLSAAPSRISIKEAEVFAVSAQLIPNSTGPIRVDFGRGATLQSVFFDGFRVHRQSGS